MDHTSDECARRENWAYSRYSKLLGNALTVNGFFYTANRWRSYSERKQTISEEYLRLALLKLAKLLPSCSEMAREVHSGVRASPSHRATPASLNIAASPRLA
jgi:hypothetical protein